MSRSSGHGDAAGRAPRAPTSPAPPASPSDPKVRARLHASFQDDRTYLAQMVALAATARSDRVQSIMALKRDLDVSSAAIQAQNAVRNRKVQERADEEARAYHELLSQGKNPHEVVRKAHVKQDADRERRLIEARIQDKQVDILQHLEVEKVIQKRRDRLANEKEAFERKYQAEMGRSVVEERTKAYLVSRTGKEQLDPTGKLVRVYPSQETTIKDNSFGLGTDLVHTTAQRKAIVDKVHAKRSHHAATANSMLLPRSSVAGNNNNNNDDRDVATPPSGLSLAASLGPVLPLPGHELREINHHKLPPVISYEALPPVADRSGSADSNSASRQKKGFGKPKRSVLEQQLLEKAREKQKIGMFQKQVVWGKEFTGDAFLADPPVLWFKDFDVGKPLVLMFTLTNVSNTFNHFKLADMDENIREYFEITYERPGRMSAGMSCTIRTSFTATEAVDIETYLPALAQTGAFQIPVKCTCKKAVPVLTQREIVFRDVVAGEKKTITVSIENRGALPFRFIVKQVSPAEKYEPEVDAIHNEENNSVVAMEMNDADQEADGGRADEATPEGNIDEENAASRGDFPPDPVMGNPNDASDDALSPDTADECSLASDGDSIVGNPTEEARESFSAEEQSILDYAKSFTVYEPKGFDSPLRHTQSGVVAPYSSTPLAFTFTPAASMALADQLFAVEFEQESRSKPKSDLAPLSIVVSAESRQVPIFTAENTLNLGCCVFDKLYRHQLVICNRGKVALKVQLRVPKVLEGFVEFTPTMGYVQAATTNSGTVSDKLGKFVIQIKFRAQPSIWRRIVRKGFGNEAMGFMAVPVQVAVPDQVVPVFFLLVARLTGASLLFSMNRIDFGECPLGHSVCHVLTIENTARVPQHFGFLKLPPEVRVEDPADGVGSTLLPCEEKTVKLIYQPSTAIPLQSKLSVRTSLNQEYHLLCTGNCTATPLVFSHNVVQLRATQVGQRQTHSILCSNISEKAQHLELLLPEGSGKFLRISPLVSRFEPGKSVRIEIEFSPTDDLFDLPEGAYEASLPANPPCNDDADAGGELKANVSGVSLAKSTAPASSVNVNQSSTVAVPPLRNALLAGKGGDKETPWQLGIPAEERSVHHRWSVLCFRRAEIAKEHAIRGTPSSSPLLAIQVETTTIEPKLLAEPARLDYSQVAIGQSLAMELKLVNASKNDIVVASKPLHILGGFRMVNCLRPIKSGDAHVIKMEFKPQSPIVYNDELCLSSPSIGTVRVPLRGEGINPSLSIQPSDGWLDFKDVLARSKSVLEVALTNASSFPLTLSIVLWPENTEAVVGSNGLPVFTFTPSSTLIPAQSTLTVKVGFNPVAQRPEHYKQQFQIKVPNESENHVLTLTGRCWEDQLYVYSPVLLDLSPAAKTHPVRNVASLAAPPLIEDPFDLPPSISLNQLSSSGNTAFSGPLFTAGLRKPQPTIVITFDEGHTPMQPLVIGSTLPLSDDESLATVGLGGKAAAPAGSFEIVLLENSAHPEYANLFSLEPMKGTLVAGQQVQVQATFNDPQSSTEGHDAAESALRSKQKHLVVSQWVQVHAICTLRGGVQWRQLPQVVGLGGPSATGNPKTGVGGTSDPESRTVQITLRAQVQT